MSSNDRVLLDSLVEQRRSQVGPDLNFDDYFELFVVEQVLWDHSLSWEEIQDGVVDGGDDGGIDSVYAFLNDELINEGGDYQARQHAYIVLHLLQVKSTAGFSEIAVDKLRTSIADLLDLDTELDDLRSTYNEDVIEKFSQVRQAYLVNASRFPTVEIHVHYGTRGHQTNVKIRRKADQLVAETVSLFSDSTCYFNFVTPTDLIASARRQRPTTLDLRFTDALSTNGDAILGLVSLGDYFNFVITETGELRQSLFESNVRDYEAKASINAAIRATLNQSADDEDFWWLNNGVTVVATRATQYGKRVSLEYPQIVNGLQSTREIYEFVRSAATSPTSDPRCVLVRVVVPKSGNSRDRIIRATNSQTTIPSVALRATDKVQRDIEDYFARHGFFYERRSKKYQNEGKPISRIVSISYLAEAILAIIHRQPHLGSPRVGGRFLREDSVYHNIFDPETPLDEILQAYDIVRHVELEIRSLRSDGTRTDRPKSGRANRYILITSMAVALQSSFGRRVVDVKSSALDSSLTHEWLKFIREVDQVLPRGRRNEEAARVSLLDSVNAELAVRRKAHFTGATSEPTP